MTDFNQILSEYVNFTQEELKKYNLSGKESEQKRVVEAMNYSLEAGGKRIRPVLVYSFCSALGGDWKKASAPACAVEMIHTFSLIHDDLPCMDDDDFRRGRPSCHKAYDEATAVLAGDALAVLPFEIVTESKVLSDSEKVRIVSELAKATGKNGMIGGQIIDMENEQKSSVDEANLKNMYRHKTGELIAVSCAMGCICAGADSSKIEKAKEYGYKLGLAFQIIDDILDVTSTSEELGKPVGSDAEENKTTFVTLYGVEKSREIADSITDEAVQCLDFIEDNKFLKELTLMLLRRKY